MSPSRSLEAINLAPPFSNFGFVEHRYRESSAIRRIFSQARAHNARSLVIENIVADGFVEDENREITRLHPAYQMTGLERLTFWTSSVSEIKNDEVRSDDLVGYATLKRDLLPGSTPGRVGAWHVFESVIRKYPDRHNYLPSRPTFEVVMGDGKFTIPGALYCQQNGLNKACAQVALRSLLAQIPSVGDKPYSLLNGLAQAVHKSAPSVGLSAPQIRNILNSLDMGFSEIDYTIEENDDEREDQGSQSRARRDYPYQKFLYAGIEAGCGGLLGFEEASASGETEAHIIPFFGHTFNGDTWIPNADRAYFTVGPATKYIPSESWVNSFIAHDDNFGSNFCVPRLYVDPEQVTYVVALHRSGFRSSGVEAEVVGIEYVNALLRALDCESNPWLKRLAEFAEAKRIVLRALPVSRSEYVQHLASSEDWERRREYDFITDMMGELLPESFWMIEVSLPELFPINQRKLGSILLAGDATFAGNSIFEAFLGARLPSVWLFLKEVGGDGAPVFTRYESNIHSHVELLSR